MQKKLGNDAATTEDIPDLHILCGNALDKKSKSANEMSHLKKPGLLQVL